MAKLKRSLFLRHLGRVSAALHVRPPHLREAGVRSALQQAAAAGVPPVKLYLSAMKLSPPDLPKPPSPQRVLPFGSPVAAGAPAPLGAPLPTKPT